MNKDQNFIHRYFWHGLALIAVIGVGLNLYLWFGLKPEAQAQAFDLPSYPVEQVIQGQTIYQANCASCHGVDGAGYAQEDVPAPALNGSMHSWHHTDQQFARWIRGGQGQMPAIGPEWSDNEIEAVLAYVKQWWEPEQLAWQTEATRQAQP